MASLTPNSVTGLIVPVGTPYRQRQIRVRYHGEDHAVPAVMSVVETRFGELVELQRAHAVTTTIISDPMHMGDSFERDDSPANAVKAALTDLDKFKQRTAVACPVGCGNAQPLWATGWGNPKERHECVPCSVRTIAACVECGAPDAAHYMQPARERLLAAGLCHRCDFWLGVLAEPSDHLIVTPSWEVYSVATARPGAPSHTKGFGGRQFTVTFADGRTVTTDNLWSRGTVPPWFRDRIAVNAEVAP